MSCSARVLPHYVRVEFRWPRSFSAHRFLGNAVQYTTFAALGALVAFQVARSLGVSP